MKTGFCGDVGSANNRKYTNSNMHRGRSVVIV